MSVFQKTTIVVSAFLCSSEGFAYGVWDTQFYATDIQKQALHRELEL